jgi:cell shape-determining protein MreD
MILRLILAVVVVSLELGLIGRLGAGGVTVSLALIGAWAFTWFIDQKAGLSWAVATGLLLDLVGFLPFGTWTVTLILCVVLTDLLKSKLFEVSSAPLALLTLASSSILAALSLSLIGRSFEIWTILANSLANVAVGSLLYYVLAVRFRFWGRWVGRRL